MRSPYLRIGNNKREVHHLLRRGNNIIIKEELTQIGTNCICGLLIIFAIKKYGNNSNALHFFKIAYMNLTCLVLMKN
jgi:hypothetical protein